MTANKLIWLNTREDILDSIADSVIGMQEAGMYSDAYILKYLDDYINIKCRVAFLGFDDVEEEYARIDMYCDMHQFFDLGV
jgi:hypothetical protein